MSPILLHYFTVWNTNRRLIPSGFSRITISLNHPNLCNAIIAILFFMFSKLHLLDLWNLKPEWKASGRLYKWVVLPMWVAKNFSIRRACIRTCGYTAQCNTILLVFLTCKIVKFMQDSWEGPCSPPLWQNSLEKIRNSQILLTWSVLVNFCLTNGTHEI